MVFPYFDLVAVQTSCSIDLRGVGLGRAQAGSTTSIGYFQDLFLIEEIKVFFATTTLPPDIPGALSK